MKSWTTAIERFCLSLLRTRRVFGKALLIVCSCLVFPVGARAASIDITIGDLLLTTKLYDAISVSSPLKTQITFQLRLNPTSGSFDSGTNDVYYGVILPDSTILSWVREAAPYDLLFKAERGLVPLARDVSVQTFDSQAVKMAGRSAFHIFGPQDPVGEYQIFCILVRPGTNPYEMRNWAGFASKIFTAFP